jgi:hypothetical protein
VFGSKVVRYVGMLKEMKGRHQVAPGLEKINKWGEEERPSGRCTAHWLIKSFE